MRTRKAKLTVENGYDLFSFHGRIVWIVRFLVDDFHALGLWFRLRYGVDCLWLRAQTLTMTCYGLEVVREVSAPLRVWGE